MLLACDVDGTIATNGNYYCRKMVEQAGITLPDADLAHMVYGFEFWEHPKVQALSGEQRDNLKRYAHAHHKDLDCLKQSIPVPHAREALSTWVRDGERIVYVTCRPANAEQLTRDWLEHYGFPCSDQVAISERYHAKYLHIHALAGQKEPVLLIDDQIANMVKAFRVLTKEYRPIALSLILRIALVQIGQDQPPAFPSPLPFPVVAWPSWRREDIEQAHPWPEKKTGRHYP